MLRAMKFSFALTKTSFARMGALGRELGLDRGAVPDSSTGRGSVGGRRRIGLEQLHHLAQPLDGLGVLQRRLLEEAEPLLQVQVLLLSWSTSLRRSILGRGLEQQGHDQRHPEHRLASFEGPIL